MIPLVVDTDPGVDDAVALLLALASPEVEMAAVTTVFGNVGLPATTANAARLLALARRDDVPLAAGAGRPLVYPQPYRAADWHGPDGLGGLAETLPAPVVTPDPRGAVVLLADVLQAAAEPVTLVAIGPLTNVALLLAVHPQLAGKIGRLVVMGGALAAGSTTDVAEFNVWSDPEAARRVLVEEQLPTTLVPLDLTTRCIVDRPWLSALAANGERGAVLARVLERHRLRRQERYGQYGVMLHDAVAMLEAIVPGTVATMPITLEVVCDQGHTRGSVVVDRSRTTMDRPVDVAVSADLTAVRAEILRRLG
jgi:pyrimidine-specific ribonucleoside hydrolase